MVFHVGTKDEIEETLDVNGKDFDELLGNESDWASNLGEAHSKSYNTLMFTVNENDNVK